jgi:rhodanese-related sulfurtransferase
MVFRQFFQRPSNVEVTPAEARRKQQEGAVIIDVREPFEWSEGHIPGALHFPLGGLSSHLRDLDASQETIMVCRSGSRSMRATQILQQAGFSQVKNMTGGMIRWTQERLPISKK